MSGAASRAVPSAKAWFLDSEVGERFPAWTRGNAADVFPEPISPLAQTLYIRPGLAAGLRDADISMGMLDWDEFEDPENPDLFKVFGGYLYNALSLVRVFGARMPGATPEAIDNAFFDSRDQVPPYIAEPWHDSPRHAAMLAETMQWAMSHHEHPRARRAEGARRADPGREARSSGAHRRTSDREGAVVGARAPVHVRHRDGRFDRLLARARECCRRSAPSSVTRASPSGSWPGSRSTRPPRRTRCGRWPRP